MNLNNQFIRLGMCIVVLSFSACSNDSDSSTLLHRYTEIDALDWGQHDTVWIDLPTLDSISTLRVNVDLEVRVLQSYPYQNLALRTFLKCNGKIENSERTNFRLFEEYERDKDTMSLESSNRKQSPIFVEASQRLHSLVLRPHTHSSLGIVHIMQSGKLQGVTHVGIKLIKQD